MPLTTGSRLGAHEILGLLGAGGMGEVYRALDTKLNRQVAIKILPEEYAKDPDRISRFHREAQAVAALNHPNIAAIHDLAESGDTKFLVLELVEGDTLADRLRGGPMPVDEALRVAKQILDALEAAHEKGVYHRDLKPANVKLTPDGTVKVLDFGLAKIRQDPSDHGALTHSPTLSLGATYRGVIMGTAGYMSPEQAKGFVVDQRSDLFSFGCVLFELLTGRQAFEGDTAAEILASVLKTEVNMSALPPRLSPRLTELLRRCLEKNPKRRWYAAGDVRIEIDLVLERGATVDEQPVAAPAKARRRSLALPIAASFIVGGFLAGLGVWSLQNEPSKPVSRFSIRLPEGQLFSDLNRQLVALSPDGTAFAYVASQRLYLRTLSDPEARAIPGTDSLSGIRYPVFAPDGQSLAFYVTSDQTLKRIAVGGGAAVTICATQDVPIGISWGDRAILFGLTDKGILRVSPNGGTPEVIVNPAADEDLGEPQMLPGGDALLFSLRKRTDFWDNGQVVVQSLATGQRKTLVNGGTAGRYLATGHLVFARSGVLLAVPFDAQRLEVTAGPVPVVEGVRRANVGSPSATAHFDTSSVGTLIYVSGPASLFGQSDLALIDRAGAAQLLKLPSENYVAPRVSPDGRFVAVGTEGSATAIIFVADLSGQSAPRQLTFDGKNRYPTWSADGQWVVFQSDREGDLALFRQRANGTGTAERLTRPDAGASHVPQSASSEGGQVLFYEFKEKRYSLWTLSMRDRKPARFGGVNASIPIDATFSPDGRWVAYQSNETGESEVFVQPFPATGTKYMVPSEQGNHHPLWSPDGKELFYIPAVGSNYTIPVSTQPTVAFGKATAIVRGGRAEGPSTNRRNHDILPDGRRFVGVVPAGQTQSGAAAGPEIRVVLNWHEELKRRVPVP